MTTDNVTTDNVLELSYADLSALAHQRADRLEARATLARAHGQRARAADLASRAEHERARARLLWRLS